MRYVVGYYCPKGSGHWEMYHDPEAEMACGSHMIEVYIDIEGPEGLGHYYPLPPGRWAEQ